MRTCVRASCVHVCVCVVDACTLNGGEAVMKIGLGIPSKYCSMAERDRVWPLITRFLPKRKMLGFRNGDGDGHIDQREGMEVRW